MRRVIIFILALLTFILLLYNYVPNPDGPSGVGGGDENPGDGTQITVFVYVDGEKREIVIKKNSALLPEHIPAGAGKKIAGIYYDAEYKHRYLGEALDRPTTLYAETESDADATFLLIDYSLFESAALENPGYSGIDILMTHAEIDKHFSLYPSEANRDVLSLRYDINFFVEKAVIIVYALAGPGETGFRVNAVRKANAFLDVNLSFQTGASPAEKEYLVFVIEVKKADIVGVNKFSLSVINNSSGDKESRYYGDPERKKTAEVTLIIGGDRVALCAPLNHTLKVTDIPTHEYYTDITIYEDEAKTVLYGEPLKEDKTLYVDCRLQVFSVVFIIGDRVEIASFPAGKALSLSDVPAIENHVYTGLYQDERFRIAYDNAPLSGNAVLYVKYQ